MATIAVISDMLSWFDKYQSLTEEHEVTAFYNFGGHRSGISLAREIGLERLEELAEVGFIAKEFTYEAVYDTEADLYIIASWDMDGAAYNVLLHGLQKIYSPERIHAFGAGALKRLSCEGVQMRPENTLIRVCSGRMSYELENLYGIGWGGFQEPTPENIEAKLTTTCYGNDQNHINLQRTTW
jgi:hypothetical protein